MSSEIGCDVRDIDVDREKGLIALLSKEGETSLWRWGSFGPERLSDDVAEKFSDRFSKWGKESESSDLELLFTGDIILQGELLNADLEDVLRDLSPLFQKADFLGGNLEGPLVFQHPSGSFPLYRYPARTAEVLKKIGFGLLELSNNHILDGGHEGLESTLHILSQAGIQPIGVRQSGDSPFYLYKKNGISVAFTAYTYENPPLVTGGRSYPSLNGHPIMPAWRDRLDSFPGLLREADFEETVALLSRRAAAMKEAGADLLVFCLHWGEEYQDFPDEKQKELAERLCEAGVDLLLGTHPHLPQPMELLESANGKHRMIAYYSLGNFLSLQKPGTLCPSPLLESGVIARIMIGKEGGEPQIKSADYLPIYMLKDLKTVEEGEVFSGRLLLLSDEEISRLKPEDYELPIPTAESLQALKMAIERRLGSPIHLP